MYNSLRSHDTLFGFCVLSNCDQTLVMLLVIVNEAAVLVPNRPDGWSFWGNYSERLSKFLQPERVRLSMAEPGKK
jgi:hypothetical protein